MRLTFRTKLVAAFLGLLLPTLALLLMTVNRQMDAQVRAFTAATITRSNEAFADAEESNRLALQQLGQRFAATSRISAFIQEAKFEEIDTALVRSQLQYELQLLRADSTLVAFTDLDGEAIGGVYHGRSLEDAAAAVPATLLDTIYARADTAGFGYHVFDDRIHSAFVGLLRLQDMPNGFVVVAQPIDNAMAERIGAAVEGEVCFVAAGRCVAGTARLEHDGLRAADMVAATAAADSTVPIERDGRRWLLLSSPLAASNGWRVIARPMDEVLYPLERIESVLMRVGLAALLVASLLAVVFARGLSRPVRALVAATDRIAHGDYSVSVPVTSRDELGALSVAFNQMAGGLLLKEQYRGLLDKVISPEIADEMLRSPVALGGENREVTVLFADIRGFTSFTEGMEPQRVIEVLNEAMELASSIVEQHGGVVDKYIGDEIMALFGAPLTRDDDALRAVRAAAGMRDALQELGSRRTARGDLQLHVGIGVNTGTVVAGNMGSERRLNYTVLGEPVNIAARLCSEAAADEILIGAATYHAVSHGVTARDAGLRSLKGLSQPMQTYAVEDIHV